MLEEIDVIELVRRRDAGGLTLLDVREADELAIAAIPGAVHIAMREIPARFAELAPDAAIAVLCHHGSRSERVANFLIAHGYTNVTSVKGGIDAYSKDIDANIPRY